MTKTVNKPQPGSLYCLSKTGPCAVISSQISSKFTGQVIYPLHTSTCVFGVNVINCPGFYFKVK